GSACALAFNRQSGSDRWHHPHHELFRSAQSIAARRRYVFSIVASYPISLTPRFSEVYGRVCNPQTALAVLLVHWQKTAEAVKALSDIVNTQLKQGVYERVSRH